MGPDVEVRRSAYSSPRFPRATKPGTIWSGKRSLVTFEVGAGVQKSAASRTRDLLASLPL